MFIRVLLKSRTLESICCCRRSGLDAAGKLASDRWPIVSDPSPAHMHDLLLRQSVSGRCERKCEKIQYQRKDSCRLVFDPFTFL